MFIFCWPCGFFGRYYKSLLIFHPSSFVFYQSVFPKPSSLQKVLYISNWKNISVISCHPIIMCFTTCLAISLSLSLSPLSVSIIIGYPKCLCTMSMYNSPHRFTFIFWHCFLKHAGIISCEVLNKYLLNMTSITDYYFAAPCVVFH